jgi:hypothetical protein
MSTSARPPVLASRQWLRFGFSGLALANLGIGVLASVAPEWFFHWFLFGRGWAGALGPYNEHYVLDLGYEYLALGIVLAWATVKPNRQLAWAAAVAALVANAPHLVFHLNHTHALGLGDNLAQDGLLTALTVAPIAVILLLWQRPEAAELPTATTLDRPPARQFRVPAEALSADAGDRR